VHPRDRFWRIVVPIGTIAVLLTLLAVGYATEPDRFAKGYSPRQPIAFSHRLHAGDNHVPCLYCHTGAERSRHAGVPALETCMNCHAVTRTDKARSPAPDRGLQGWPTDRMAARLHPA
jgi:hypothetical protein